MYEHILFPTDGSGPADTARDHAIDLAATTGATLHVLFVVDDPALHAAGIDATAVVESYEAEGERITDAVADLAAQRGVTARTDVRHGSPHEGILAYAGDVDADLIVMGTHGRRGLDRYLLGSVTERVVRTAEVPVVTVRGGDTVVREEDDTDDADDVSN